MSYIKEACFNSSVPKAAWPVVFKVRQECGSLPGSAASPAPSGHSSLGPSARALREARLPAKLSRAGEARSPPSLGLLGAILSLQLAVLRAEGSDSPQHSSLLASQGIVTACRALIAV